MKNVSLDLVRNREVCQDSSVVSSVKEPITESNTTNPSGFCFRSQRRNESREKRQLILNPSTGTLFSRHVNLPSGTGTQECKNNGVARNASAIMEASSNCTENLNACDNASLSLRNLNDKNDRIGEGGVKCCVEAYSVDGVVTPELEEANLPARSAPPLSDLKHTTCVDPSHITEGGYATTSFDSKEQHTDQDVPLHPRVLTSLLRLLWRYNKVAPEWTFVCGGGSEKTEEKEESMVDGAAKTENINCVLEHKFSKRKGTSEKAFLSSPQQNSSVGGNPTATEAANSRFVRNDKTSTIPDCKSPSYQPSSKSSCGESTELSNNNVMTHFSASRYWVTLLSKCSCSFFASSLGLGTSSVEADEKGEWSRQQELEQFREESVWLCRCTQRDDFQDVLSFSCGLLRHLLALKEAPSSGATLWRDATKNQRFGMIYQKAHRPSRRRGEIATISQLISVPFVSLQIFSSFVCQMSEELCRSIDSTSVPSGMKQGHANPSSWSQKDDNTLPNEMDDIEYSERVSRFFGLYFTPVERKVIIAACTLLAWKLADVDATVHIFQEDREAIKVGVRSPISVSSVSRKVSRKDSGERNCSLSGCHDGNEEHIPNENICSTGDAITAEEENAFEVFRKSGIELSSVIDMESYIVNKLSWKVGAAPLWWRVAVELVHIYFIEYLMKKSRSHEILLRKQLDAVKYPYTRKNEGVEDETRILLNIEESTRCQQDILIRMHSSLEQLMLGCVDVLLSCQAPSEAIEPRETTLTVESVNVSHTDGMEYADLREVLVRNPLFGFSLAIVFAKVPLEWVTQSLVTFSQRDRIQFSDDLTCLIEKVLLWQRSSLTSDVEPSFTANEKVKGGFFMQGEPFG